MTFRFIIMISHCKTLQYCDRKDFELPMFLKQGFPIEGSAFYQQPLNDGPGKSTKRVQHDSHTHPHTHARTNAHRHTHTLKCMHDAHTLIHRYSCMHNTHTHRHTNTHSHYINVVQMCLRFYIFHVFGCSRSVA
jgi:hypothetical protein